jgi:hypothetical protein
LGVGIGSYEFLSIQVIPEASAAIIERFGRYSRTLTSGPHRIRPFADSIRFRLDLRRQTVPFPVSVVLASDEDTEVQFNAVVHYKVTDPYTATYGVASFFQALDQRLRHEVITGLRGLQGNFNESALEELRQRIQRRLIEAAGDWGLTVYWFGLMTGDLPILPVLGESSQDPQPPQPEIIVHVSGDFTMGSKFDNTHVVAHNASLGDGNTIDNRAIGGPPPEQLLHLATALVGLARADAAQTPDQEANDRVEAALVVQAELQTAHEQQREPDTGRLGRTVAAITAGLSTTTTIGAQIETLITQMRHLLGL